MQGFSATFSKKTVIELVMGYFFINKFIYNVLSPTELAGNQQSNIYTGNLVSFQDLNLLKVQGFAIIILFVSNVLLILLLYFLFKGIKSGFRSHLKKIQYLSPNPMWGSNSLSDFVPEGEEKLHFKFDYDVLTHQEKRKLAMLQMNLRADAKWEIFKKWFNETFPDFYIKLIDRFPELTQGDLRLLSLIKLNLANKDMALRLGISIEGVKKSKQRLRKKLNIDLEILLDEITLQVQ